MLNGKWKLTPAIGGTIGFGYGLLLLMFGILAAGGGHGTYVPLGLFSSPLGLTQDILVTVFGLPLLWLIIGVLLGLSERLGPMAVFLGLMLAHYGAISVLIGPRSEFGSWYGVMDLAQRTAGNGAALILTFAPYAVGQVALWILFNKQVRMRSSR